MIPRVSKGLKGKGERRGTDVIDVWSVRLATAAPCASWGLEVCYLLHGMFLHRSSTSVRLLETSNDCNEMTSAGETLVFIGMPLYNNARTLRRALDAILAQTERRYAVLMSDDGSTDETVAIAREYSARDERLSLFVQPKNLNYGNFRYLLNAANSPFFVFLAGDDWWKPEFLAECLIELEKEPSAVCVVPRVQFESPDGQSTLASSTSSILGDPIRRVARYLHNPSDNSRMYGVFRTEAARRAFPARDYFAYDWAFSATSLIFGDHRELSATLMHRETTPSSAYVRYVQRDAKSAFSRLFPLFPLTVDLLRQPALPVAWPIVRALLQRNIEYHLTYTKQFWPRYYRLAAPVLLRIQWRLGDSEIAG